MAPSRRNARVPRATSAQRAPTPPASPQREEVVQEAATPNTINLAQVGNSIPSNKIINSVCASKNIQPPII